MENLEKNNILWSKKILQILVELGVNSFCLSPGSRSTPLVVAAFEHPRAEIFTHFDERGTGFFALGLAKAEKKPVAIIVTSGTSVANLLPAVIEASLSKISLLILSADRPFEMKGIGANQAIEQMNFFSSFTNWQYNLPPPDPEIKDTFLKSILSYGLFISKTPNAGPVQINCMFRKPLFSQISFHEKISPVHYFSFEPCLNEESIEQIHSLLLSSKKGMIFIGENAFDLEIIFQLAERLNWPVYLDICSQKHFPHFLRIHHFNNILECLPKLEMDCVLHFGDRLILSEKVLAKLHVKNYLFLSDHAKLFDPGSLATHRVHTTQNDLKRWLLKLNKIYPDPEFFKQLYQIDQRIEEILQKYFSEQKNLSDSFVFFNFLNIRKKQDFIFFISNSTPIRYANSYFQKHASFQVFCNRGASGIDGLIATSCGISQGHKDPIFLMIGDTAFLHDLNYLALMKKYKVILFLFNNGGGNIFSLLPDAEKIPSHEQNFVLPHLFSFKKAAEFFHLPFTTISQIDEWKSFMKKGCASVPQIIEIKTDLKQNVKTHFEIKDIIKLCHLQKQPL